MRACDRRNDLRLPKLEDLLMSFDIERATTLLAEARRTGQPATGFKPGPADVDEAYAVQDRITAMLGPVGGWKVGAKTPDAMPNTAPLMQDLVQTSPAAWPKHVFHLRGVEAEIAFKIGRDIPAGAGPIGEATAFGAVESVHAAIEIVDTRLDSWKDADPLWQLADHQSNAGFVYDPAGIPFSGQDFTDAPVRLVIDGRVALEQRGGNTAGDPRRLLLWLIDHAVQRRGGLKAGTMVTTGSYTGMIFVDKGARVEAEFEGLGRAETQVG